MIKTTTTEYEIDLRDDDQKNIAEVMSALHLLADLVDEADIAGVNIERTGGLIAVTVTQTDAP